MLKNAAFAVKIGVDTADILAFWAWNEFWYFPILPVFWYFGPLQIQNESANILH